MFPIVTDLKGKMISSRPNFGPERTLKLATSSPPPTLEHCLWVETSQVDEKRVLQHEIAVVPKLLLEVHVQPI